MSEPSIEFLNIVDIASFPVFLTVSKNSHLGIFVYQNAIWP